MDIAEAFRARLRADLKAAMRMRRAVDISVLRSLIAAVDNAQAVPTGDHPEKSHFHRFGEGSAEVPRLVLSQDDLHVLLAREIADRRAAASELVTHGQGERAEQLMEEITIIERYERTDR